jgi:phage-related protein
MDKTTKMMETAAVIANKRGMAMSEVSDRIRSAMNQEADGADELGVNVRVNAMQQSKAYKEMANGKPWSELSTNMQKAILYQHILDSVSTNLGDTLQHNTALKMAAFTATLGDANLALGNAFLPIVNQVLPYLTAFASKLTSVLSTVSQFTQALFGKGSSTKATAQQTTAVTGLGNALKKTGKEAQKATGSLAGFDEINQLADPSSTGGGSDAAGASDESLPLSVAGQVGSIIQNIDKKIQELANTFKEYLKPLIPYVEDLKNSFIHLKNSLGDLITDKKVGAFFGDLLSNAIKSALRNFAGSMDVLSGSIDIFVGLLNGNWSKAWEGAKTVIGGFAKIWVSLLYPLFPSLAEKIDQMNQIFAYYWPQMEEKIRTVFTNIKTLTVSAAQYVYDSVTTKWGDLISTTAAKWDGLKSTISSKWDSVISLVNGAFKSKWDSAWSGISNGFPSIFDGLYHAVKTPLNWIIDAVNTLISGLNKINIKAPDWVPGLGGKSFGIDIPKIPKLAKGGITNGPTLAMIGDNPGGQEVVSPLDKLSDIISSAVGTAVMSAMQFSKPQGSGGDIILNIDGRTFGRIIKPFIDMENKRVGTNIMLNSI